MDYEHQLNELESMLNLTARELMDLRRILRPMSRLKLTTDYAMRFIGTWYKWGGETPAGFDCSGFCQELLKMLGYVGRREDYTAHGLWELFKLKRVIVVTEGCFVCFASGKNPERVGHIEYCVNKTTSIGASNGGSKTLTVEDAIRDKAFIKARPIERGRKIIGYFNPFLKEVG